MTVALDSLRRRASEHGREPRRHLERAIADYEGQLEAMNDRLRDLAR
jgi:hypothetical protein